MRGATEICLRTAIHKIFQSTRPLRGATRLPALVYALRSSHFNPRAPCGARLESCNGYNITVIISIHAPLAGRDEAKATDKDRILQFQSTRPLRGATRSTRRAWCASRHFNPRAPCGARRCCGRASHRGIAFQSTRPLRGATSTSTETTSAKAFQSTRPLRGATAAKSDRIVDADISIHAPLAGRDSCGRCTRSACAIFQSTRPLRGATASGPGTRSPGTYFNPRAPCGARLLALLADVGEALISIHAPLAGRDSTRRWQARSGKNFNPRAPCGARPAENDQIAALGVISIHAPLAGRDPMDTDGTLIYYDISIHAPLAGRDWQDQPGAVPRL